MFHVVLLEPEIPPNTGNIARTCMVTGSKLHLVRPLGFDVDDKTLKRAGLDYWQELNWCVHDSYEEYAAQPILGQRWYFDTPGDTCYTDVTFQAGDHLIFGKETTGLSFEVMEENRDRLLRIPMLPAARSMNLSNAVAVVLYETLRQTGFHTLA
ncbi:MAG: tRNA (cytidine(34)-2'-O)-methyltransferase [Oscillospiraceae bacterium]|nr:tRNA (cytidine(34)-2'-O)-methyltransferase [Oscillospiraceae bacterium]